RRSGADSRCAMSWVHSSALSAFLRSGRSIVATPTRSRTSQRIMALALVDDGDQIALLHDLLRLDVELTHDAGDLGDDRDLHLHRLEDDDLVPFGDHLPLLRHHLPHVRRDLGPDLRHRRRTLRDQTGRTPCLRQGRSTRFERDTCRPRQIARRVSAGAITSSRWAWPAAMYGAMFCRISSAGPSPLSVPPSPGAAPLPLPGVMFTAPARPLP